MSAYTDVFGGQVLEPAQVAYASLALSANTTLVWPQFATTSSGYVAGIMEVTPSNSGYTITMPDASLVSPGQSVVWRNLGNYSFTVADASGNAIATIAAGAYRLMYVQDNSSSAGLWASILLGVGSSSPDASQLAGSGLKAIGSQLAQSAITSTISTNYTVVSGDRCKNLVWTGGAGTLTLPTINSTNIGTDFFVGVRNSGTGVLTITPSGGDTIDGSSSASFQTTDSAFLQAGPSGWYTVGRGRSTQFNFTKLTKSVTGGTTTLSMTEAANVVQDYSGTLLSNQTIVVPQVVQVYYVINGTSGAYTFKVQTAAAGGTSVTVESGKAAILFCDGTNIINCTTSGTAALSTTIAVGSAGSPTLNFVGDTTTGVFQPSSGQWAVSVSGTQVFLLTSTGINGTDIGTTTPGAGHFSTLAVGGNTLTLTGAVTFSGAYTLGVTLTGNSAVTLPTSGTLVAQGAITSSGLTQNTGKLLGRTTASSGAVEEITAGTGLTLSGGSLTQTLPVAYAKVSGSNFSTSSATLTNITGLSVALAANSTYFLTASLSLKVTGGSLNLGVNYSVTGATIEGSSVGSSTSGTLVNERISAFNTAGSNLGTDHNDHTALITALVTTGANAGNLTIQTQGVGGGTVTAYIGSAMMVQKVA